MVTIALPGVAAGTFYIRVRRLFPQIQAHGLYDGVQLGAWLLTHPGQ